MSSNSSSNSAASSSSDSDIDESRTYSSVASHNNGSDSHSFTNTKAPHFYEQLGAPTLLYRHGHRYGKCHDTINAHNTRTTTRNSSDTAAAEYDPSDEETFHSWKPWRVQVEDLSDYQMNYHKEHILNNLNHANRARLLHYNHGSLGRAIPLDLCRHKIHQYDIQSPYITMTDVTASSPSLSRFEEARIKMEFSREHMHASPRDGYTAPFEGRQVRICLGGEDMDRYELKQESQKFITKKEKPKEKKYVQNSPHFYGNCLVLLPCHCAICNSNKFDSFRGASHNDDQTDALGSRAHDETISADGATVKGTIDTMPPWSRNNFLLYPKGQNISISSIAMPHIQNTGNNYASSSSTTLQSKMSELDVGSRVMQLEPCFNPNEPDLIPNEIPIVVRTAKDCSVIICRPDEQSTHSTTSTCQTKYNLQNISCLNFCDERGKALEPIHVAARHYNATLQGGTVPTFATVCKSNTDLVFGEVGPNIVHYTTCNGSRCSDIHTQQHHIRNLASISQIHFSNMNPNVLWSAARSKTKHEFYRGKKYQIRPAIGYGHSLHSIDLRSNTASFVWSPSDDDFVCKGIHSVNGVLIDEDNPYSIFVSTSSLEGKMFHIDGRMPGRSLYSWSLAGMCDNERIMSSPSGIYGAGMILAQPNLYGGLKKELDLPILGAKKEPNAFGFHLFQKPSRLGNFQTRNLERMAHVSGLDSLGSFATSSFFALPHVSESIFTTGIAAFYSPLSLLVKDAALLGYAAPPKVALCVISANSNGDLHSYSMIACPADQSGQTQTVTEGPLGACAVPLPGTSYDPSNSGVEHTTPSLAWRLSNAYPSKSNGTLPIEGFPSSQYCILDPNETSEMNARIPRDSLITIEHPPTEICFGDASKRPPVRRPVVAHVPKDRYSEAGGVNKKRRYTVKHPSENLKSIASTLRSRTSKPSPS